MVWANNFFSRQSLGLEKSLIYIKNVILIQRNLSITTTSKNKLITCDLFINVFGRYQFTRANNFCILELQKAEKYPSRR